MPTVRVELEDHEIRKEIAKHGYGFQLSRNYPIWLTFDDVVDETDVGSELKLAKGISFGPFQTCIGTGWIIRRRVHGSPEPPTSGL